MDINLTILWRIGVVIIFLLLITCCLWMIHKLQQLRIKLRQIELMLPTVIHDVKQPLTMIKLYNQLKGKSQFTQQIDRATTTAEEMLNSLLIAGKLETTGLILQKEVFSLKSMLDAKVDTLVLIYQKRVFLRMLCKNRCLIYADKLQIERVIQNILFNAIRYSPEETSIKIKLSYFSKGYKISIQDRGQGISKKDLDTIFTPYVQVGESRGGFGLGLFVCKKIVDAHGGKIKVESKPGHGSIFTICLPKGL